MANLRSDSKPRTKPSATPKPQRDRPGTDEEIRADELARLRQQLAEREQALSLRDTEIARYEREIANINNRLWERKEESNGQLAEAAWNRHQRLKAENRLALLQDQNATLSTHTESLTRRLQSLRSRYLDQERVVSSLSARLESESGVVAELSQAIRALKDDCDAIFDSFSWRSGNLLKTFVFKLTRKPAGASARDHMKSVFARVDAIHSRRMSDASSRLGEVAAKKPDDQPEQALVFPLADPVLPARREPSNYQTWIEQYDFLSLHAVTRMRRCIEQWCEQPFISIVMTTFNTRHTWLRAALESVVNQVYSNWELCIADDASTDPQVRQILNEYLACHPRIKVVFRPENGHISAATNSALGLVKGDFVTFLDHDDLLPAQALFWMAKDIYENPGAHLWYSDEDKISEEGERYDPYFKTDWNPDLLRSQNYLNHLVVYRTTLLADAGGIRLGYEGAQDYDLALRAIERLGDDEIRHVPRILYHWRAVSDSTASRVEEKPYAEAAAKQALQEHLVRTEVDARVSSIAQLPGGFRVRYALPPDLPLVSLIIPTRNCAAFLRRCVESILDRTEYENFELLIVDNQSTDVDSLYYLEHLRGNPRVRVIEYPHPFNYSAINNFAANHARGTLLCLLNNDIEVGNDDWLAELVSHALRPEVGIVGAKLLYPDDSIQHSGVILGIGGAAGHAHRNYPRDSCGYYGRICLVQNYSAVTAACMLVGKADYLAVGGLEEEKLSVAYNDVDFCLKIGARGLRVVYTPFAELFHFESYSRGDDSMPEKRARAREEREYIKRRWGNQVGADFAYNPNLTLDAEDFDFARPPRIPLLP